MSWLTNAKSTRRRKAGNFTHDTANKRLQEALPVFRDKISNALQVDSVDVVIYKALDTGKPCMCRVTLGDAVITDDQEQNPDDYGIEIDSTDMFGEDSYETKSDSVIMEAGDLLSGREIDSHDDDDDEIFKRPIDNSPKCGICYRTGYTPPFEAVGFSFYSFDATDLEETHGYYYSQSDVPTKMIRSSDELRDVAYVKFDVAIPKYFKQCKVAIRDNLSFLTGLPWVKVGDKYEELTLDHLDAARGDYIEVYVREEEFTHITFLFSLGAEPIRANLSEEANGVDFMTMNTIGNMQVVLPYNIGWIKPHDIIHIPSRNLVLKVTDAPRKTTARQQQWEWNVATRVLQPNEDLHILTKGRDLY